jgi:uncharacterized protein YbjT (DUF2867 family)
MHVLLTGVTGYIARRLLPLLLQAGHQVTCVVRDPLRLDLSRDGLVLSEQLHVVRGDFLDPELLKELPRQVDVAYYLIHSMSQNGADFGILEAQCARNFRDYAEVAQVRQVIYLGGLVNAEELSDHLASRQNVENFLRSPLYGLTILRAGIIVGSGSASFEIIRDLVEKLPIMVAPKWLQTKCQPIAVRNVLEYLMAVMGREDSFGQAIDIGGPQVLTYRQMLLAFAKVRRLRRWIFLVPVMTPKLSSYWLYFLTSTSYPLALALVDSMKIEVVCRPNDWATRLGIACITYEEAIRLAFVKVERHEIVSSWKDALTSGILADGILAHAAVPTYGCLRDQRFFQVADRDRTLDKIWKIGGTQGWYVAQFLWELRGALDQMVGGVGMRRGRRSPTELSPGDALDFWRVLVADKAAGRLLLYAEMKLPGEAWLEFRLDPKGVLWQTASFRPLGLWGRLYWWTVWPFHGPIFRGMLKALAD